MISKKKTENKKSSPSDNTGKKYKKKPSVRMLNVFRKVLESKGKISIGEAMMSEGYPASTARNPQQLTNSKGWQELLKSTFPDDLILKYHKNQLNAHRLEHNIFPLALEDEDIVTILASVNCTVVKIKYGEQAKHVYFWSPDNIARDKALDKIYKITGKYAPQKIKLLDENDELTDEEIEEELQRRGINSGEIKRKPRKNTIIKKKAKSS